MAWLFYFYLLLLLLHGSLSDPWQRRGDPVIWSAFIGRKGGGLVFVNVSGLLLCTARGGSGTERE